MPKNFYYIEQKSNKKIIEHATLSLYDSKTLYNVGDQFQDSNGTVYTTIKSNKKFCVLANTYKGSINGINVQIGSYLDPELISSDICETTENDIQYGTAAKSSCSDSIYYDNKNISGWYDSLQTLLSNIATNFYSDSSTINADLTRTTPSGSETIGYGNLTRLSTNNINNLDTWKNTSLTYAPIDPLSNEYSPYTKNRTHPIGLNIVFKENFSPPLRIELSNTFSTILGDSNSIYFSYFFQKEGTNQPDKFSEVITQSNIDNIWNKYISFYKNYDMTPKSPKSANSQNSPNSADCCTIS